MSEEELQREILSGAFSMQVADCERNIRIQFENLQQENNQLKEDLKQVLDDVLKAFENNNNCIDWNFTEIREKYNFDLLKGDKE